MPINDDLLKKLRILAIQEDKHRDKAAHYLQLIENEIAYALYCLYGKNPKKSHSKLTVHIDEGLIFIYDYSDLPDKEGFVFEIGSDFNKSYYRLSDEKGKRFWDGIEVVMEWIPKIVAEVVSQEKAKGKIINHLEKLTESVQGNEKGFTKEKE
ncbi:hypothetical protein [Virgibacillus halodenitrificans]|uniref:hypothetical protein n=1 Tax=Virgibacillus halodenitrificans TaxID=1482 RepID=UPI000EF48D1F|nr:hypothetical protein [Virgibacillus halodenitrificans]